MKIFQISFIKERLLLIHQHMIVVTVGNLVAIGVIFLSLDAAGNAYLSKWVIVIVSLTIVRAAVWVYYHHHPYDKTNAKTRLLVLFAFMFVAGALWGSAGIALFNLALPYESVLLMLVFAALVSGTLVSLSSVLPLFIMYATLVITPLGLFLLIQNDSIMIILGASLFIFLLANVLMSVNVERSIVDMIQLRDDNEKLITELIKQKDIAEQSNIDKSKFLAAISHDLRQPMHAMGLFLNGLHPHIRKSGEEVFNKVHSSTIALRSLFNGLLDLSRLDAGAIKADVRPIDLSVLLQKIADGFSGQAQEKGLQFVSKIPELAVCSDPMLLERVIRNLLANAIQYTDSGKVSLTASTTGDIVYIVVEDEGQGIPSDELENIFSSYHQLHNAERDRDKGVGLGLAIVRRICELLSIPIQVNSRLGHGSVFRLQLPVAELAVIERKKVAQSSWDLEGQLMVVVDDEQDIRDATEQLLKTWGCETIIAETGVEAIDQLTKQLSIPSALIVDYRLRGETGIGVIEQIRAQYKQKIPAMIITGDTTVDLTDESKKYGTLILHKPLSAAELRTAIHQLINHSKQE